MACYVNISYQVALDLTYLGVCIPFAKCVYISAGPKFRQRLPINKADKPWPASEMSFKWCLTCGLMVVGH